MFLAQSAQFEELITKIDDADFKEDWESVVLYCNEALKLREDENIKRKLERAKERLEKERNKEKYKQSINEVKALMTDNKWGEAKNILKELQRIYPNHKDEIRQLFARIFDAETANTLPPKNVANEKTNRGNHSIKGGKNQEDILDIDPGEWPNIGKEVSSKDTDSGFFDSDNQVKTQKKDKRVIHNDEFDF